MDIVEKMEIMQSQIGEQKEEIDALKNTISEQELKLSQQNTDIIGYRNEIQRLTEQLTALTMKRTYKSRSKEEAFEVMELYHKGYNISQIAEQRGMDRKTVRTALITAGVVIETKRGRPKTKMSKI